MNVRSMIAAVFFAFVVTATYAEQSIAYRFVIVSPQVIKQGEMVPLTIRAELGDKSVLDTAENDLIVSITNRAEGTVEIRTKLVNGTVSLDHIFKDAGSHLIKVADAADPKFFKLGSVTVLANRTAAPNVRP